MSERIIQKERDARKKQKPYHAQTRGSWGGVNPCTRTFKTAKDFNKSDRNKMKAAIRKGGADYE